MRPWLIILIIITFVILVCALRIIYELHTLRLVKYVIYSEKIRKRHKILFFSDLHGRVYGSRNRDFIKMVRGVRPEIILIAGDLVTYRDPKSVKTAEMLLHALSDIAPVFYIPGNHEQQMIDSNSALDRKMFERLMNAVAQAGVYFLENEAFRFQDNISIIGFAPDQRFYPKFKKQPNMPVEYMDSSLRELNPRRFNIMLAHHPGYFRTYAKFGPDLIVSGHYHGGAVRIAHFGGIISPQFKMFPKYFYGRFRKLSSTMIVTAGSGSHKVNLRLNNMPELVAIDIRPPR